MIDWLAKRVADARQHGCHYAEGTCEECQEIARGALAAMREPGWLVVTAPRVWGAVCEYLKREFER